MAKRKQSSLLLQNPVRRVDCHEKRRLCTNMEWTRSNSQSYVRMTIADASREFYTALADSKQEQLLLFDAHTAQDEVTVAVAATAEVVKSSKLDDRPWDDDFHKGAQELGIQIDKLRKTGGSVQVRALASMFIKFLQQGAIQEVGDQQRELMMQHLCEVAIGESPVPDEVMLQVCK